MLTVGPLAFLNAWLLAALILLPVLWWLLRLLPPAPRSIPFPAIRLLFGLHDDETTPQAAPWWLTLLRLALAALLILAAARPVLNPDWALEGQSPILVVIDDGWGAAPQWEAMKARADVLLAAAERANRSVYLLSTAPPASGGPLERPQLMDAASARSTVAILEPKPWPVDRETAAGFLTVLANETDMEPVADAFWFTDGLAVSAQEAFSEALSALGRLTVFQGDPAAGPFLLSPPAVGEARLSASVQRPAGGISFETALVAYDENGRPLGRQEVIFDPDSQTADAVLDLPLDLRNAVTRLSLEGQTGIGGVVLLDDRYSRRPIGILTTGGAREALPLLSEVYFLDRALRPLGTVDRGPAEILLRQSQAMLLLPDETVLETGDADVLRRWISDGGTLVRFAGPRLASAKADDLVPVSLRGGGRQLSGAMLWTEPARIGEISKDGPLAGMLPDKGIAINRQVLAEPALDLDRKTWLRLEDDTPLITANRVGDGWLVLVHTTANTEWSNLALSGFFVEVLARLSDLGSGIRDAAGASGLVAPFKMLDWAGRLVEPDGAAQSFDSARLDEIALSASTPPGYYGTQDVRIAVNLSDHVAPPESLIVPEGAERLGLEVETEKPLLPYLLILALGLLLIDTVLTTLLRGFSFLPRSLGKQGGTLGVALLIVLAGFTGFGDRALAQTDLGEIPQAALTTTLAFVLTGDPEVDSVSRAGLDGLSDILRQRTAVEAGDAVGLDLEQDDLVFYPLLYWPVLETQTRLTASAVDRLNAFMAAGGVILFDTRDGHLAGSRFQSGSEALRILSQQLNIPPVSAVPPDHVLTRSFYLMQDFPGRWEGGTVWVETNGSATNDGVSPILVGDADWASAWATDARGRAMFPISDDGRQREMAFRFGVNLVMYTLTGNYKADQVHISSILERLGQ